MFGVTVGLRDGEEGCARGEETVREFIDPDSWSSNQEDDMGYKK